MIPLDPLVCFFFVVFFFFFSFFFLVLVFLVFVFVFLCIRAFSLFPILDRDPFQKCRPPLVLATVVYDTV